MPMGQDVIGRPLDPYNTLTKIEDLEVHIVQNERFYTKSSNMMQPLQRGLQFLYVGGRDQAQEQKP